MRISGVLKLAALLGFVGLAQAESMTYYGETSADRPSDDQHPACGPDSHYETEYFVAVKKEYYESTMTERGNSYSATVCDQCIRIVYQDRYAYGRIVDSCPGCRGSKGIDVSPTLFSKLVDKLSTGRVDVQWEFAGSCSNLGSYGRCDGQCQLGDSSSSSPKKTTTTKRTTTTTTRKTTSKKTTTKKTTTTKKPVTTITTTKVQPKPTTTKKIVPTLATNPIPGATTNGSNTNTNATNNNTNSNGSNTNTNANNTNSNPSNTNTNTTNNNTNSNIPTADNTNANTPVVDDNAQPMTTITTPSTTENTDGNDNDNAGTQTGGSYNGQDSTNNGQIEEEIAAEEDEGTNTASYVVPITGALVVTGAAGLGLLYAKRHPKNYEAMKRKFPEAFTNIKRSLSRGSSNLRRGFTRSGQALKRSFTGRQPTSSVGGVTNPVQAPATTTTPMSYYGTSEIQPPKTAYKMTNGPYDV